MPPDGEWVQAWVTQADRDLAAAGNLLAAGPSQAPTACFHAQQAVEKYLKAYLVHGEVEFGKVHAIRYLLDLCERLDPEFACLRESAEPLTRYAVGVRYPAPGPEPGVEEAQGAVETAQAVARFVLARLREPRPPDPRESPPPASR